MVVIAGETPSFEWSPKCRAAQLDVHNAEGSDTGLVWGTTTWHDNTLDAPVVYGVIPAGAFYTGRFDLGTPAPTLTPGRKYRVALWVHHQYPELLFGEYLYAGGTVFVQ